MLRLPGLMIEDHITVVPLDHTEPDGPSIEVFAREVVAAGRVDDELPWLLFLQGGPGSRAPRPLSADGWLGHALQSHRILLLDHRGTGRSSPVSARTVAGMDPAALAAYLRLFRADSIVADAELLRGRLLGDRPWETLGQSYGGFVTLTYLSRSPEALRACYVTGGLPALTATAQDVYARTYPRVAARNAQYYRRYPDDVRRVQAIANHLDTTDVRLPDGDRLTTRRFRTLGMSLGMSDGLERLHWLLDGAWHAGELCDAFLHQVMTATGFIDAPLYALQEFCYAHAGRPTAWAAERALAQHPAFAPDARPLLFTGEMMYRWMFRDIAALKPFAEAADLLAAESDWPDLYAPDRLADNPVPIAAAVYFDDMYVDASLQLETAGAVGNTRVWVTNEYGHDGVRTAGARVLGRLMDIAAGP